MNEYKYLWFNKLPKPINRKTYIYEIRSRLFDNRTLGLIKWYASWRRYVFTSCPNCIFDAGCLADIQNFINKLMSERKEIKQ